MTNDHLHMKTWYGNVVLDPAGPIEAGSYGTWRLSYTVGRYGVDNGGRMKLAFRLSSDWGSLQFSDPSKDNYVSASTTGQARIGLTWEPKGYLRPYIKCITLQVYDGTLKEGDQVVITLGDTSGGGRGTRAQTFIESDFQFKFAVESFETGIFVELPSSPVASIISTAPERLVALAPSLVVAGAPFAVTVKAEDQFGNPARRYDGVVRFDQRPGAVAPQAYSYQPADGGTHRFEGVILRETGTFTLTVQDSDGRSAVTNPIRVVADQPSHRLFWADIHGQTGETVGAGSVEEYFAFARDVAALDVTGHQGNDFQITKELWAEIQRRVREYHEPGRFITFLGWEWSGNHPAGGDHNVFYPLADSGRIHRSSHWQIADKSDAEDDRYPVDELYKTLKAQPEPVLMIPHVGGRHCNLDYHDPDLEPVVEVTSVHGRFEWLLEDALRRGYKVGVVGNGDDHTCRPGAAYPTDHSFGVRGGLTGIYATELTREAVFEAYKVRRTYATTGVRIYLNVSADGRLMGSEYNTGAPPVIRVHVIGTAPLDRIEIKRGTEVIYSHPLVTPEQLDRGRIRVLWGGARIPGRGRHTTWDGHLKLSEGTILEAATVAFDAPAQGLTEVSRNRVAWTSSTSGDVDGVILRVDAPASAKITFESQVKTCSFSLAELAAGPIRHDAGGLDQHVEASLLPRQEPPMEASFEFTDTAIRPGLNAYYVRLMQTDGEMAWSSPIYVNFQQ